MGLGDFLEGAGKAVGNVAKGAEWAITHPDKVVKGAEAVGSYAIHHPGTVGKIAAKELVKSFTDPKELAINAALIGATVATAGAAAPVAGGVIAGEVGGEIAAETGTKVVAETAAKTTARVAEETAAKTTAKVVGETGAKVGTEAAGEALAETGAKATTEAVAKTGLKETANKVLHPFQSYVTGPLREWGAEKILQGAGEEAPGMFRQAAAAVVQGQGYEAPKQLEGMSDTAYKMQKLAYQASKGNRRYNEVRTLDKAVNAAADPMGYVSDKLSSGGGRGGDSSPPPSAYGASEYGDQPSYGRNASFAQGSTQQGTNQTSTTVSNVESPQMQASGPSMRQRISEFNQTGNIKTQSGWGIQLPRSSANSMHSWQGPQREALGGIGPEYDWRKMGPLRPIQKGGGLRIGSFTSGAQQDGGAEQIEGGSEMAAKMAVPKTPLASMSAKAGIAMEIPKEYNPPVAYDAKGGQGRFTFPELSQPTSQGARMMKAAGTGGDRGGVTGRNDSFVSGSVYGEAADTTLGGTMAWNNQGQGSFVFPQLTQPAAKQPTDITTTGTFTPATPSSPFAERNPALPALKSPMAKSPMYGNKQTLGV